MTNDDVLLAYRLRVLASARELGSVAMECDSLAHILADGSLDRDWHASTNGTVNAVTLSGGTVYAGGGFTSIGSGAAGSPSLARV